MSVPKKPRSPIDFMRWRKATAIGSIILLVIAIGSLAIRGLNPGLDFTEGSIIEIAYQSTPDLSKVRSVLATSGFDNASVQQFGSVTDVIIRVPIQANIDQASTSDQILQILQASANEPIILRRVEFVGPTVGQELREQGGLALIIALGLVMLYIMFRFVLKFSVSAVVALAHDVLIVLGVFSIFQLEFSLPVLAALLAVIGYSLNDTIVVSDRIRENFRTLRKGSPTDIINISLNQVLTRTLVTSFTTLLVLFSLTFLGGEFLFGFSVAMIVGVLVGTYSSIYVAANTLLLLNITRNDLMLPEKEGSDDVNYDQLP